MQSQTQQQSVGSRSVEPSASIFGAYAPPAGAFDELIDADGSIKPVWREFCQRMDRIGPGEWARRWARSQRLIEENGIAYSPFGDTDNRPRPWALDPAPLLIPEAEWSDIARGLEQRAELLELLLNDLYGEQRLIADGVLPAEVLYGHPGYRLPLHKTAPSTREKRPPMLPLYAADVGRAPDGGWWVLADRTEAPSGIGFALENRVVTSRMLAEPFREGKVRRLAPFFMQLQSALRRLAPTALPNPAVAILSQGGSHRNYFEDAYLARYLGYMLVEGNDLTVRDRRLWMKTLDGLTPIDVLLRRPNTEDCDPLELRGQAASGVAGLLQAERSGSVLVANASGSGLVESPVFMAFMPRLCKALLGESLRLPGVASWWCGEPDSLEYVVANLDRLVLKRAYRLRGKESSLMAQLRDTPRDELVRQIQADPRSFVAQEVVNRSTAPAWQDGAIVPVRVALRAFTLRGEGGRKVMQGALARTSPDLSPLESTAFAGEGSKDVWVIGEKPVRPISLLPGEDEPIELVRLGSDVPSRVADHSFWFGRHLERADAAARLIRIVATRLTSEGEATDCTELPALVRALAEIGQIEPGHAVEGLRDRLPSVERMLPQQVLSQAQPSSLRATIDRMFAAGSQVRDRLSRDTWRIVLRVNEGFRNLDPTSADLTDVLNVTNELILDLAALGGMVIESMTRTQFYRFLDIGRRLERAIQSIDVIQTCLIEAADSTPALLESLLDSADSLMTYRARYRASVKLAPVLDLLITDETNPRSIAYQLNTLERHVGKLPQADAEGADTPTEQRLALDLAHSVRMTDIREISESYELNQPRPLGELLNSLGRDLPALGQAIALKYLAHAGPTHQLAPN